MMTVNGLELPASFVKFFEEERYANWDLKERVDAYGNPLEADFEPLDSVERMEQDTAELARYFGVGGWSSEELQRRTEERRELPGFIPYINDFSKIVWFGRTPTGAPFCFDFRENVREPSVVYFPDCGCYWRRVAPNFDTFIGLFELSDSELDDGEDDL